MRSHRFAAARQAEDAISVVVDHSLPQPAIVNPSLEHLLPEPFCFRHCSARSEAASVVMGHRDASLPAINIFTRRKEYQHSESLGSLAQCAKLAAVHLDDEQLGGKTAVPNRNRRFLT